MQKILYLIDIFVKSIFWQISNETAENQDLYRNKDDFDIFSNNISVKCISSRI